MKKPLIAVIVLLGLFVFNTDAFSFWIWTPKEKGLVNPKHAAKDTPEEQYSYAMKLYEEGDYKQSAEQFLSLTNNFKESELAPDAQYYAGRSYEAMDKPYPAFESYQKVVEIYPYTARIDEIIERQYNLGLALYHSHRGKLMGREIMTDLDRAVEVFEAVRKNVPFGEYAEKAQFMVGESYKKSEQYPEAMKAFQKLVDEYPRSPMVEKAKYEVAQCTYLASLKPEYDQETTDRAIREFKELSRAGEDDTISKEAMEALTLLEDRKAESIYKTARFYEGQKHYESATIYYMEILNKYPRSSLCGLAERKIKELKKFVDKEKEEAAKRANTKGKKWIFF